MILDIGENTIKKINNIIDQSKTVLWNGPAGYFEVKEFSQGSSKIAKKISENTKKAFKAGCDLVLHCNARYSEMIEVAKNSPKVNAFITKKTSQFYKILS